MDIAFYGAGNGTGHRSGPEANSKPLQALDEVVLRDRRVRGPVQVVEAGRRRRQEALPLQGFGPAGQGDLARAFRVERGPGGVQVVLATALEEGDHVEAPPLHLLPGAPEEAAEVVLVHLARFQVRRRRARRAALLQHESEDRLDARRLFEAREVEAADGPHAVVEGLGAHDAVLRGLRPLGGEDGVEGLVGIGVLAGEEAEEEDDVVRDAGKDRPPRHVLLPPLRAPARVLLEEVPAQPEAAVLLLAEVGPRQGPGLGHLLGSLPGCRRAGVKVLRARHAVHGLRDDQVLQAALLGRERREHAADEPLVAVGQVEVEAVALRLEEGEEGRLPQPLAQLRHLLLREETADSLLLVHVHYAVEDRREGVGPRLARAEVRQEAAHLQGREVELVRGPAQRLQARAVVHALPVRQQRRQDLAEGPLVERRGALRRPPRRDVVQLEHVVLGEVPLGEGRLRRVLLVPHVAGLRLVPPLGDVGPLRAALQERLPGVQDGELLGHGVVARVAQVELVPARRVLGVEGGEAPRPPEHPHAVQQRGDVPGAHGEKLAAPGPLEARQHP
mmetsp:Transcript_52395/g.114623  ORF Transcript_52395/g.114623 Transcript_52395/m.114623 type:complete len:560 (+) Transcript_52395:2-1681(+)